MIGLVAFVGDVETMDSRFSSLVGFRNAVGFAATADFLDNPFVAPFVGFAGGFRLSKRVTISVIEPLRICDGRPDVADSGGREAFDDTAGGDRRDRDEVLLPAAYMDCGRALSLVSSRRADGRVSP